MWLLVPNLFLLIRWTVSTSLRRRTTRTALWRNDLTARTSALMPRPDIALSTTLLIALTPIIYKLISLIGHLHLLFAGFLGRC